MSLHDQDRSQGRILFGSYSPSESEIPEIPVAKQSIPVLFYSVRSEHCTVSVYSPHETSSRFPEETGCSPNLVPGRYAHNWFDPSRSQRLYPDGCESPKSAGIHNQPGQIGSNPNSGYNISRFTINSITMRFTLPSEKVQKLLTLCRQIRSSSKVLLRILSQLLGLLESYRLAVWQAPLHFRYLQALLIRGLNQMNHNYEAPVSLCSQSLGEINWWLQNLETVNSSPIITPSSDLTIFTDASLTGWGAACGNIQTNGKWSAIERQLHINVLELKGEMLGIQSLLKNQSSKIISLNMDSSTAVAYINHKGGHPLPRASPGGTTTLELVRSAQPIHNSIPCSRENQCGCRSRVERIYRQQRLESRPDNHFSLSEGLLHRPVCVTSDASTCQIHQLEA